MNGFLGSSVVFACLWVTSLASSCKFPTQTVEEANPHLLRLDGLLGQTFTARCSHDKSLIFKFQLCGNPSGSACKDDHGYQLYQTLTKETQDSCTVIAEYDKTFISGGSNWVGLVTSTGNSSALIESTITFLCNPAAKDELSVIYPNWDSTPVSHYSFVFNTHLLCETPPSEGLSGGSVFCIIFFTVLGVYFLFGFLYQRIVVKAKGVEQIPNYDKWKEFGNLLADGCDFMCRCGGRQEAKMYQGIGDGIGNEESEVEERDDRLLPM